MIPVILEVIDGILTVTYPTHMEDHGEISDNYMLDLIEKLEEKYIVFLKILN